MNMIEPSNQTRLFGLNKIMTKLVDLENKKNLPNKILLSGQKGLGKSTLAYHFINYTLSKDEESKYDLSNFVINPENRSFKTVLNNSNTNFKLIDNNFDKKNIDINQIRELIRSLNKSSFNEKPRFILIDNIELLNLNSINALLKTLEEPSHNIYFILINNNKKIISTLLSRCINFKISLRNDEIHQITNKIIDNDLYNLVNKDLLNYYSTPGSIYNLIKFGETNQYDLVNLNLNELLKKLIKSNNHKKDSATKYLIFDFIEFYLRKINISISTDIYDKYTYFLNKISDIKKFNLDEEALFIEFEQKILNE